MLEVLAYAIYVAAVFIMVVAVIRMLIIAVRSGLPSVDDTFPARSFAWPVTAASAVFIVASNGLIDPDVWLASFALAAPFGVTAAVLDLRRSRSRTRSVARCAAGAAIVVVGPALMAIASG